MDVITCFVDPLIHNTLLPLMFCRVGLWYQCPFQYTCLTKCQSVSAVNHDVLLHFYGTELKIKNKLIENEVSWLFSLAHVTFANMEDVWFMTITAASNQGAMEMLWLRFWKLSCCPPLYSLYMIWTERSHWIFRLVNWITESEAMARLTPRTVHYFLV